ncbi:MAG: 3-oxoacyl-[acyl-carrier-protein] reductase FabG [Chlamydiia bacterium]|nr:3-oxoacyl-[acyl-carrier-protein] reductase FabG [Chlamydiia bacterium]MCH9615873.1 3-oxoacyl-[acyl-carrier-protein] reductase FabG [Chlamydiia bacterium]MCH9628724.1 3-oxoacyl-[acyl-carrier-protein] reductase FabG [Chlamydiia bacterium]
MLLLKGKRALITGGTSGLGRAIAKLYAKHGAKICIWGTNEERANSVVEEVLSLGAEEASMMLIDVSKTEAVSTAFESLLEKWGGIDIIVNCAGITRDQLLMKMKEEDWDQVMDVNLKSCYNVCRAAVRPMMKQRAGQIINVTSVIGLMGNPGQVNYSASKHGMIGLTRSLAKEVGSRGIRVNGIAPGMFETPMTDVLPEKQREALLKQIPMGRLGNPEEIAQTALFLGSDMSEYITGQVITVDGGMLA